jgi:hypothetical protein
LSGAFADSKGMQLQYALKILQFTIWDHRTRYDLAIFVGIKPAKQSLAFVKLVYLGLSGILRLLFIDPLNDLCNVKTGALFRT